MYLCKTLQENIPCVHWACTFRVLCVQQYCTAVAGVLHYTRGLALQTCMCMIMKPAPCNTPNVWPRNPQPQGDTHNYEQRTRVVHDLEWTGSQMPHSRRLNVKGKQREYFSALFWWQDNKYQSWYFVELYDYITPCTCCRKALSIYAMPLSLSLSFSLSLSLSPQ